MSRPLFRSLRHRISMRSTGLPIDTNALVAATGSGDSWTVDTNAIGADGDYVVLVGALDDAGNIAGSTGSFNLDTQITTPSVNTIAVDDIVNIVEDGVVAITLSGVDADCPRPLFRSLRHRISMRLLACRLTQTRLWQRLVLATAGRSIPTRLVPTVTMWCWLGRWTTRATLPARLVRSTLTQITTPSVNTLLLMS